MAQPQVPAQQLLEQAMLRNELAKLPVWFGDPTKDAFRPEDWWRRFELAAGAAGWNWQQVQAYFDQALRGPAIKWYRSAVRANPPANIDDIKNLFLNDYGRTAAARTSVAQLKITQKSGEKVRDYRANVQQAMDEIELSVDAMPVPALDQIFVNPPADVVLPNAQLAYLRAQYVRIATLGYQRLYNTLFRNIFIDGLLPPIRDEVIRRNPPDMLEAYEFAKQAERDLDLKSSLTSGSSAHTPADVHAFIRRPSRPPGGGSAPSNNPRPRTNTNSPNVTCYYCNKRGHVQKDCFKRQREKGAYKPGPRSSVKEVEEAPDAPKEPNEDDAPNLYNELMSLDHITALNW